MSAPEQKWERPFDAVLGIASAAILMCMMLLTFVDVVARYLFNFPLRGGTEITELMLMVLIFAGVPLVSHADEHVTMDFIDRILSARAAQVVVRLVHAACAAVMFFVTWQMWLKAGTISRAGDFTDVVKIPYGPFVYFMAVMLAVTGLVHLYKMFVPGAARASQATT
jgi:TRAP-type C4-dicarboxylate transport system permease small subunit